MNDFLTMENDVLTALQSYDPVGTPNIVNLVQNRLSFKYTRTEIENCLQRLGYEI